MSLDKEPISDSSNVRTRSGSRAFLLFIGIVVLAAFIAYLLKGNIASQREIGPIHAVAFCPGDRQVVTANQDGTVRLWDVATGQEVRCYRSDQSAAGTAVAVSPEGRHILATQNYGQSHGMVMWDLNSGQVVRRFRGHTAPVNAVAFCPDNIHVVSVSSDRTVRIWDTTNGLETKCLQGHEGDVNAVAVTKDGRYVISGAGDYWGGVLHDSTVRVWDFSTGKCVRVFDKHDGSVYGIAVSPDDLKVASCGWDGHVRIWQLATGEEVQVMECQDGHINSIAWSADGRTVLTSSGIMAGVIILWDAQTGEEIRTFKGDYATGGGVAFSSDGKLAVTGHGYYGSTGQLSFFGELVGCVVDGVARIWNVADGEQIQTIGSCKEMMSDQMKRFNMHHGAP